MGQIQTTFDTEPVVGERVTYTTVGPNFTATGSGIYDGVRPSEHDGTSYHYLRDGEINGVPQSLHGFPVEQAAPPVGSVVVFREGSAPYARNAGVRFVVTASPRGVTFPAVSIDRTHGDERPYVWLVDEHDVERPPSRQRTRSAYVTDLAITN